MRSKYVPPGLIAGSVLLTLAATVLLAQERVPSGAPPPGRSLPRPVQPANAPPLMPTPSPGSIPGELIPPPFADSTVPGNRTKPIPVPPPHPELALPPPAIENALFTPGVPNLRDLAMAVPSLEVWRPQSHSPQIPARQHRRFEQSYVVGKEWAMIRLRFHPLAAGQGVWVRPGPGVAVIPADTELRVERNGECVLWVALDRDFSSSDIMVSCHGVRTKVPLSRAPVEVIEAREAAGRSGR